MLGPLQDNGGPTFTHAFVSCSPAIDAGKNFAGSATDQRGLPRSFDDPARPNAGGGDSTDIGAFEAQAHVPDITPPNLNCPADIFANETPGTGTRVVTFAPVVRDNCDPSPTMSCAPPSGSTFSIGTTTVTCRAADVLGNSNQCSFTVTICPITITVTTTDDSGPGSLRQAILDANACTGKNIIEFAPNACGTILLTSGELLIADDLCINGPGVTNLAVDGNAASRVLHVAPSNTVTIAALTITNGFANGFFPDDSGGGIFNDDSTVTVSNCFLSGNSASFGGGIANSKLFGEGATMTVIDSVLKRNSAQIGGGILNAFATLSVASCVFSGNSAYGEYGGGICNSDATLSVSNSTFCNNSSSSGGGGIWNTRNNDVASATIVNSTLNANSAQNDDAFRGGLGGGIGNEGASLQVLNTTLSGNNAGTGGGIYNGYSPNGASVVHLVKTTLSENSASLGGCIYNGIYGGGVLPDFVTLEIGSTILKAGPSGGTISNDLATVISLGYNLSSDDGGSALTNTADQINTDPLLGPLHDNGGPTFTHALLCGSPAIDKGSNFSGCTTDQRGLPRTFDRPQNTNVPCGDGSDIGAFEAQQFCTPFLSNFGITSNRFGFNINAESNQLVAVEASTNLTIWSALATNAIGGGPLRFNDTNPPSPPHRFYRARTQ